LKKLNILKNQTKEVWLELAYKKWIKKEFDEGIIFITSTEVALLVTQKVGIDLPVCVLKEHPKLLQDTKELKPLKQSKVFGFVFYLPSINDYQQRTHDFHRLYSDLGRVYL